MCDLKFLGKKKGKKLMLGMRLPSIEIIFQLCFVFFLGPMTLFIGPPNSGKRKILGNFGSYSTIHIFRNYFITVFSIINFQLLANNWYPRSLYWVEVVAQKFNLRTGGKTFGLKVKTRVLTLYCYSVTDLLSYDYLL